MVRTSVLPDEARATRPGESLLSSAQAVPGTRTAAPEQLPAGNQSCTKLSLQLSQAFVRAHRLTVLSRPSPIPTVLVSRIRESSWEKPDHHIQASAKTCNSSPVHLRSISGRNVQMGHPILWKFGGKATSVSTCVVAASDERRCISHSA